MKKFYLIISSFTFAFASLAQPTLTSAQVSPIIGEQLTVAQGDYLTPGPSGANQTWDFSAISTTGSTPINMIASDASHPGTNIVYDYGGGTKLFANMNASEHAFVFNEAGGVVIDFSNSMKTIDLPISTSTNMTDNFAGTFISGGIPFTRQGTSTFVYEGYGTVITPSGTYTDCIKTKLTQIYSDTYTGGTINYVTNAYYWYSADVHYAVAAMIDFTTNGGVPTEYSQFLVGSSLDIKEASIVDASVYPNPTIRDLNIDVPNHSGLTTVKIYSTNGSLVLENQIVFNNGQATLPTDRLESGVYILEAVLTNGTIARKKFQKK